MIKVKNLKTRSGKPAANQFDIEDLKNDVSIFQSYDSPIIKVDRNNLIIEVYRYWNQSRTTSYYRNEFLSEMGLYELNTTAKLEQAFIDGYVELDNGVIFYVLKRDY